MIQTTHLTLPSTSVGQLSLQLLLMTMYQQNIYLGLNGITQVYINQCGATVVKELGMKILTQLKQGTNLFETNQVHSDFAQYVTPTDDELQDYPSVIKLFHSDGIGKFRFSGGEALG